MAQFASFPKIPHEIWLKIPQQIEIVAGIAEMNDELSRILKVVRFDPAFM